MHFIKRFGTSGLKGILADREFASGKIFKWLNKKKLLVLFNQKGMFHGK